MSGRTAVLNDRGVIEVVGRDARDFLQRLITNDVERLQPGEARYAALLTPQGKITADFFVVLDGTDPVDWFMLDVPEAVAGDLVKKLNLYRLRAMVRIVDRTPELAVVAAPADAMPADATLAYADPRAPGLWHRAIVPRASLGELGDDAARWAYREQRVQAGIPEGGIDFVYGETFPHEANLDRLHGVDFKKGCYVGQEVVSRVEHRGTARKRVVPLRFEGEPPPVGAPITLDGLAIGTMGSAIEGLGLGLIRLDRTEEGRRDNGQILAAGVPLTLAAPGQG